MSLLSIVGQVRQVFMLVTCTVRPLNDAAGLLLFLLRGREVQPLKGCLRLALVLFLGVILVLAAAAATGATTVF